MLMLLLCNVFTLSAAEELYAQHYNVTLSLRNATVKEAVDAVTRQTGIAFSYESSVGVMPLGNVEIRVDGGAVDAVLGPLFADKGIAWQVVDGVVILTRQNSPPQSDSGRRLTVRGRITAGAGESIVGATVMVKGTTIATAIASANTEPPPPACAVRVKFIPASNRPTYLARRVSRMSRSFSYRTPSNS